MNEKLGQIKLKLDWLERLDVTCSIDEDHENNDKVGSMPAADDFKKEMKL